MKRIFILIGAFVLYTGIQDANGQSIGPSTLNGTGYTATLGGNTYDWSVGEMTMVSTFTGPAVIVTQGVLQADPAATISGIPGLSMAQQLQVFPNPASSIVNLRFTSAIAGELNYKLIDVTGKTMVACNIDAKPGITSEQMDISYLAAATYMLNVSFTTGDKQERNSYKIEKLK